MVEISGGRGTGKTTLLIREAFRLGHDIGDYSSILFATDSPYMLECYDYDCTKPRCSIDRFIQKGAVGFDYLFVDDMDYLFRRLAEKPIRTQDRIKETLYCKLYGYCLNLVSYFEEAKYLSKEDLFEEYFYGLYGEFNIKSFKYFNPKTFKNVWTERISPRVNVEFRFHENYPFLNNATLISI